MPGKHLLLFVQGGGEGTHDAWDNKLVDSLQRELGHGYEIRYPRMPREEAPDYARWKPALEAELATLGECAILVGHSVGGTILIKLLTELRAPRFRGIFLIAPPFLGAGGWPNEDVQLPQDLGERLPAGVPIHFFHGLRDETVPPLHVDLYARAVAHARVHRLPNRDHQLDDDLKEVAQEIVSLGDQTN